MKACTSQSVEFYADIKIFEKFFDQVFPHKDFPKDFSQNFFFVLVKNARKAIIMVLKFTTCRTGVGKIRLLIRYLFDC